jgi:hypothetical protein
MSPPPAPVYVGLDICIDGRFVRTVSISAAELATALAADLPLPEAEPGDRKQAVGAHLLQRERLRLTLTLFTAPPADTPLGQPQVTTYAYDAADRVIELGGTVTTTTYYDDGAPDPPPDEPHIAE